MSTTISQRDLRNQNADIMRRVEAGERFVVTRHGRPVADVVPHAPEAPTSGRRVVDADELVNVLRDLPDWGRDDFDDEQVALDSLVDDEPRDPWS